MVLRIKRIQNMLVLKDHSQIMDMEGNGVSHVHVTYIKTQAHVALS